MKTLKIISSLLTSIPIAAVLCLTPVYAQSTATDKHAKKIESVLDKLERRLIDKETSPLTQEESERATRAQTNDPAPIQKFVPKSSAKITGKTPSGRNLQELEKKINEYDNRVEILESDLRKLRSNLQDAASTDNLVSIEISAERNKNVAIRTMTATLDGNTLYDQLDPAGLWMPVRAVPVFYGPLQPGSHRLDISATLASMDDKGIESSAWTQKSLKQTFNFVVPEGKARKTIAIEISDTAAGSRPVATLKETEVP